MPSQIHEVLIDLLLPNPLNLRVRGALEKWHRLRHSGAQGHGAHRRERHRHRIPSLGVGRKPNRRAVVRHYGPSARGSGHHLAGVTARHDHWASQRGHLPFDHLLPVPVFLLQRQWHRPGKTF
jgi:hypothetical protein